MKVASYTIIHYGVDYLPWALMSTQDICDVQYVFYTALPSHNYMTDVPCPDTFEQVEAVIHELSKMRMEVRLIEQSSFRYEGQQRDWCKAEVIRRENPDFLIVVDSDEVWRSEVLRGAMNHIATSDQKPHTWRINMRHFWRSFDYVCNDQGWPDRIFDLRQNPGEYGYIPTEYKVDHFGYAVRDEIMEYKWKIHGHKAEMRRGWLENIWHKWEPGMMDVHPTNDQNFWDPEYYGKELLPELMHHHPFYKMDIIR